MSEFTDFIFGNDKEYNLAFLKEEDLKEKSWQTVLTPETLCDALVNIDVTFRKGNKVLTMFNIHVLKILIHLKDEEELKNLYFIADSEEKYNMVKDNFPQIHLALLEEKEWNIDNLNRKIKGFKVKKFDMVFSNPPYSKGSRATVEEKNLDFTMLEMMTKHTKNLSFIMTARFLTNSTKKEERDKITPYCESIILFNGNDDFGTSITYPLCIIKLNMEKKNKQIYIEDRYYTNTNYYLEDLNDFTKYNLNEEEKEWWNNYFNNELMDNFKDQHCEDYDNFKHNMGFYLSTGASAGKNGDIIDIVTMVDSASHIFTNKISLTQGTRKTKKAKEDKKTNYRPEKEYYIVPINSIQEGQAIYDSYNCEIIRAIVNETKCSHRIIPRVVKKLPWPVDANGNIKSFTNTDWVSKLNMPQSLADKIINYYNNHPELKIR